MKIFQTSFSEISDSSVRNFNNMGLSFTPVCIIKMGEERQRAEKFLITADSGGF